VGIVQTKQGSITSAGFPVTLTITLDNPTGSGNTLIVVVAASGFSSNPTAVACTLGGVTGNFVQDSTFGSASDAAIGATWRDQPAASGQTAVAITATGGAGISAVLATVYECDDLAAAPFDKNANSVSAGSGTWTSTATPTTTQASERLFGAVFTTSASAFGTITGPSNPWVNLTQVNQTQSTFFDSWLSGSQDVAVTGAYTYNGTVTSTPQWIAKIVTYKLATAAAADAPAARVAPGWHPGRGLPGLPGGTPFLAAQPGFTIAGSADAAVAAGLATGAGTAQNTAVIPVTSALAYAAAAADLGGGAGSWVNPGNADGPPDSTYATWTSP
jgi:hypothetical protein